MFCFQVLTCLLRHYVLLRIRSVRTMISYRLASNYSGLGDGPSITRSNYSGLGDGPSITRSTKDNEQIFMDLHKYEFDSI